MFVNKSLNNALRDLLKSDEKILLIGEDILDPYGGAFKVTKGLTDKFPKQVYPTPISEASIVGIGTGLSMMGFKPIVEIMFGDFITLCADQIINHLAKFYFLHDSLKPRSIVIRTPMGGGRGYGPTHSQSLEKLFLGVDGLNIVAQHIFSNAGELLKQSVDLGSPVLFIENKINYSQINEFSAVPEYATITKTNEIFPLYEYSIKDERNYDYIIITYGGMVKISYDVINSLYENEQIIGKLIAPTNISDFQYLNKKDIFKEGDNLITLEEGNKTSGFGSEVIANMSLVGNFNHLRISKEEGIISNSRYLEDKILPTSDSVYNKIVYFLGQL